MPCRDGGPTPAEAIASNNAVQADMKKRAMVEAIACALMRNLLSKKLNASDATDMLDLKVAGVSKNEVLAWWKEHQKKDEEREKRELDRKLRKELALADKKYQESGLKKLTEREKKALKLV